MAAAAGPGPWPRTGARRVFLVPSPEDKRRLRRLDDAQVAARPRRLLPRPARHLRRGRHHPGPARAGRRALRRLGLRGLARPGMDKALMKALFAAAGLPQARYRVLLAHQERAGAAALSRPLGLPVFVKPANLGLERRRQQGQGRGDACGAARPRLCLRPQGRGRGRRSDAREIEIAVLGNDEPAGLAAGRDHARPRVLRLRLEVLGGQPDRARDPRAARRRPRRRRGAGGATSSSAVDARGYARVDFLMDARPDSCT